MGGESVHDWLGRLGGLLDRAPLIRCRLGLPEVLPAGPLARAGAGRRSPSVTNEVDNSSLTGGKVFVKDEYAGNRLCLQSPVF